MQDIVHLKGVLGSVESAVPGPSNEKKLIHHTPEQGPNGLHLSSKGTDSF
jgi:hypothetical protein